ncbi:tryptophan 7-halogenase, partial [uncultured Algoriphagus sp.]|uniref:tryptophan 7-halogenase n=1 Tax=uncultured Algoriphagus sp. TaxID=417365 RepID=UPI002599233D
NVVAVGNSAGFVEPLEASALMLICSQCEQLVAFLQRSMLDPTPSMRKLYNRVRSQQWQVVRDFLGVHYKFNTAVNTPFWRRCREETDLSGVGELLEFYEENGPSGFSRRLIPDVANDYGIEGFLVMLVGNKVPHRKPYQPSASELRVWNQRRALFAREARKGIDVRQALSFIRQPGWKWHGD